MQPVTSASNYISVQLHPHHSTVGAAPAGGGHGDVPGGDPLRRLYPDPAGLLARPGQAEDRHLRVTRDCHADSSHRSRDTKILISISTSTLLHEA